MGRDPRKISPLDGRAFRGKIRGGFPSASFTSGQQPECDQVLMSDQFPDDQRRNGEPRHDVTRLLARWRGGDDQALDALLPLIYEDLRRLSERHLNHEPSGQTLQTHDLIHEAFLRLIDQRHVDWQNRAHFFGIASQMMRRILTDHARRRSCGKRGGGVRRVVLDDAPDIAERADAEVVAVDEALTELKDVDEQLAKIVELRYFGGLHQDEISVVLGISNATVGRRFRIAKAWLYRRLSDGESADGR
jgi:RNA polymerase sigma factor (TIGR02999 family)